MMNRRWIGSLLMTTAVLHELVGIYFYATPLTHIVQDGIFNSIAKSATEVYFDRDAAFWFLVTGALLFVIGYLVHWVIAQLGTLPPALGWSLLGLSVAGVVLMPLSGFWLVLIQAMWITRVGRRETAVVHVG
jgi:hypothetical protein